MDADMIWQYTMLRNQYRAAYVTSNKLPYQNRALGRGFFMSETDGLDSSPRLSLHESNQDESESDDELSDEWLSDRGGEYQNLKIGAKVEATFWLPDTLLSKELDKKFELRLNEK